MSSTIEPQEVRAREMISGCEPASAKVDLRCFPSDDSDFAHVVRTVVGEVLAFGDSRLGDEHAGEAVVVQSIERRLRHAYPNARVRPRDQLAAFGLGQTGMLYAFRDGQV
ncbi:MAG TPA: hypothetical protein VIV06_03535 [Candidatus Limnocylindrales bacterium]